MLLLFFEIEKNQTCLSMNIFKMAIVFLRKEAKVFAPSYRKKPLQTKKEMSKKFQESEANYQSIFGNKNLAILVEMANGKIISANETAHELFGYTNQEFIEIETLDLIYQSDQRYLDLIKQQNSALQAFGEMTLVRKDQSTFLAEVSSVTFIDSEGNKKITTVVRDFTSKHLNERKMKTMIEAIEQCPAAIIITDENENIEFVNAKFTSLMQYTLEDVKGKKPRICNPGHLPLKTFEKMQKTLQSGDIWQGYSMNRKMDGTLFWENAVISPIVDQEKKIVNFVLILEDITERKQMIDDLMAAKNRAEESDRLKTAFLQNISHEIRTPMNAILGFSGLLNETDIEPEKRAEFIQIINRSGERLMNIINSLIELAKIESKQMEINEKTTYLNALLRYIIDDFKDKATQRSINIEYLPSLSDSEATVHTDSDKLRKILENLMDNAIKFTNPGGSVRIGYTIQKPWIKLFVEDTGIGIPPHSHDKIFKRFSQVDDSTKRNYGGTGLGLSIVKAYVDMQGGQVRVESEPGHGSIFHINLPYKKARIEEIKLVEDSSKE
jgi:PAS domain S-box-containing protein